MLPDYLAPNLDVIFVGTSVGSASAANRHYYSDPRNRFWQLLWEADLTGERLLIPEQDSQVLKYGIGLTDVVKARVSSSDAALRTSDYDVPGFLAKIEKLKPFVVAFNGKKAAEKVFHAAWPGRTQAWSRRLEDRGIPCLCPSIKLGFQFETQPLLAESFEVGMVD
jgi:TDG/mug DNA glycosylase family protein